MLESPGTGVKSLLPVDKIWFGLALEPRGVQEQLEMAEEVRPFSRKRNARDEPELF